MDAAAAAAANSTNDDENLFVFFMHQGFLLVDRPCGGTNRNG